MSNIFVETVLLIILRCLRQLPISAKWTRVLMSSLDHCSQTGIVLYVPEIPFAQSVLWFARLILGAIRYFVWFWDTYTCRVFQCTPRFLWRFRRWTRSSTFAFHSCCEQELIQREGVFSFRGGPYNFCCLFLRELYFVHPAHVPGSRPLHSSVGPSHSPTTRQMTKVNSTFTAPGYLTGGFLFSCSSQLSSYWILCSWASCSPSGQPWAQVRCRIIHLISSCLPVMHIKAPESGCSRLEWYSVLCLSHYIYSPCLTFRSRLRSPRLI